MTVAAAVADLNAGERLKICGERLAVALIDRLAGLAADKVDGLSDQVEKIGSGGGLKMGAIFGAGNALMAGRNPLFGAMKGAWGALGTGPKIAIIVGLVLLGVLSPVALLLLLVGLLIAGIVSAVKS
ncbi:hypothetical protein [Actinomycetospora chiangmaiensis]|uniref:hypothetical protein n=1 Tax=Actinomycetospora chiangmaiensis TaxID=402650 RepID=UPI00037857A1|nr:hypothetical protein [Actinomycetospora chiangmaiensis]